MALKLGNMLKHLIEVLSDPSDILGLACAVTLTVMYVVIGSRNIIAIN